MAIRGGLPTSFFIALGDAIICGELAAHPAVRLRVMNRRGVPAWARCPGAGLALDGVQHPLVVLRHHFDKPGKHFIPAREHPVAQQAAGQL